MEGDPLQRPRPAPGGEKVLALFDMDLTLLTANSANLWLRFELREGRISRAFALKALGWILQYRLGVLDIETVTGRVLSRAAGDDEEALVRRTRRFYEEMVRPTISWEAVARLETHRSAGHVVAIVTGSTEYGAAPLAEELKVENLVATRLLVENGRLTGGYEPPMCFGRGKLERARRFADAQGAELSEAWFYSDSYTDLPVLEAVRHPVAVNPDPRLLRHARKVGWPVVHFS